MGKEPVNDLIMALGSFAEMTHVFYNSMISTGADKAEATAAMNAFIHAFWHEQMEDARRKKREQEENG